MQTWVRVDLGFLRWRKNDRYYLKSRGIAWFHSKQSFIFTAAFLLLWAANDCQNCQIIKKISGASLWVAKIIRQVLYFKFLLWAMCLWWILRISCLIFTLLTHTFIIQFFNFLLLLILILWALCLWWDK